MTFKNDELRGLVKPNFAAFGNCFLNDVQTHRSDNPDGTPGPILEETKRIDGKTRRKYYVATYKTLEARTVAATELAWQDHSSDGKDCRWKSATNPKIAEKQIGDVVPGLKIAQIEYNQDYEIESERFNSATSVMDKVKNSTNKFTCLFITEDDLERQILRHAQNSGLLKPVNSGVGATQDDSAQGNSDALKAAQAAAQAAAETVPAGMEE